MVSHTPYTMAVPAKVIEMLGDQPGNALKKDGSYYIAAIFQ